MILSGRVGEHYDIVELLGSGGMGEVYLAVDRKMFDRAVAIKFLSERLTDNDEGRARFRREVETSARLHHPNIVTIYDWGEHQGRDFFVMEFVDGSDLQELLRTGISWDLEQRLEVAFQVTDALDFAHRAGIIHRDIKPGNVMVVLSDSGPRVKLVDFGIAHVERSNLTQTQNAPGTCSYMSPEQLRGDALDPLDARRDLFSLGIVLCELFSGHHPFGAKSDALIISHILHDQPVPPSRHGANVPPELESLILRMLEKDPVQRPGTARDVAEAIRELLRKAVARSASADPTVTAFPDLEQTRAEVSPEDNARRAFVTETMREVDAALDAGNVQESLTLLSKILREYPDEADAAALLDRLVQVAASGIPYGEYRTAVRAASAAVRTGDTESATAALARAAAIWPDGPDLHALRSEISAAREVLDLGVDGARSLLTERPDHPAAGNARGEVLAEIERVPPKRGRSRLAGIAAIGLILVGLGSAAAWKLFGNQNGNDLDKAGRLPESSEKEVAGKLVSFRLIDRFLPQDDARRADLTRQVERLEALHEMYVYVERLRSFRLSVSGATVDPGTVASTQKAAKDVWKFFRGERSKLASDDKTAMRLEEQGESILLEIQTKAGSPQ